MWEMRGWCVVTLFVIKISSRPTPGLDPVLVDVARMDSHYGLLLLEEDMTLGDGQHIAQDRQLWQLWQGKLYTFQGFL